MNQYAVCNRLDNRRRPLDEPETREELNMPRMPSVGQLRELMTTMYPEDDSDSDHPTTAVGIVLLPASIFGLTEEDALVRFTGYPRPFIYVKELWATTS